MPARREKKFEKAPVGTYSLELSEFNELGVWFLLYKKGISYLGLILPCLLFGFVNAVELDGLAFEAQENSNAAKLAWLKGRLGFVPDGDSFSLILKDKKTNTIRKK